MRQGALGNGEEHCNFQVGCQDLHFVALASLLSWPNMCEVCGVAPVKGSSRRLPQMSALTDIFPGLAQAHLPPQHHLCAIEMP